MPTEFTSPVGRIVWGDPTKPRQKTDRKTKQPIMGANGQPRMVTSFGVAFAKADFQAGIWPHMAKEAATLFANGTPNNFAWKYVDGDTTDAQGQPYSKREGYAGCYVLSLSTELPPPGIFKFDGTKYNQVPAEGIKCGDYVAVGLSLKANKPADVTDTPGLYVNPTIIELVGYGTLIVSASAPDPTAAFGGQARQLPPGASATPVGAPAGAPGMPGMAPTPQPAAMAPPAAMPGAPAAMPGGMPGMAPVAAAPQRPTDPSHIAANPAGGEFWWNGTAWTPAPMLPPPAPDFVANAGMPAAPAPGGMPGMMPPR